MSKKRALYVVYKCLSILDTNLNFLGRHIRNDINLLNKPISKMYLKVNTGIYILAFLLALNTQNNQNMSNPKS